MIPAELHAQFAEAAEREAQRGYEMYQLVPGSDVDRFLQATASDDFIKIVRGAQAAKQQSDQPSQAA